MTYRQLLQAMRDATRLSEKEDGLKYTIATYGGADTQWMPLDRLKMQTALDEATAAFDGEISIKPD